ncbi:MAG: methylmalonyl Co-A mutase-associated GTPase MeaB, partial [Chloroflexota bacterium]
IAVDPSSPFSGGALLGDRVRMNELAGDKGIFIRSLASRGSLGGLAKAANQMAKLLDAAGYNLVLIETVGAGQSEVDIVHTAHTTVVIEAPGMGDGVQSIKAGILEIADILVVNKADVPGSAKTVNHLKNMLHLGPLGGTRHHGRILNEITLSEAQSDEIWQIPVIATSATTGDGIDSLANTILNHRTHLETHNQWVQREIDRSNQEVTQLVQERLLKYLNEKVPQAMMQEKITAVAKREIDLYSAVDALLQQLEGKNNG